MTTSGPTQQNPDGTFSPSPIMVCGAHGPLLAQMSAGLGALGDMLKGEIRLLREDMSRRMDESAEDRASLHEAHNELAREVTATMTRLNGAKLVMVQPHHRDGDPDGAKYPREHMGTAAVSAFPFSPRIILSGAVVLAVGFGIGLILLVQTKLDLDTIKAVQQLRNPPAATGRGEYPGNQTAPGTESGHRERPAQIKE